MVPCITKAAAAAVRISNVADRAATRRWAIIKMSGVAESTPHVPLTAGARLQFDLDPRHWLATPAYSPLAIFDE